LIDPHYIALGSIFILCLKSYNQTRLGLKFQTKRNPYTKRILITKENIKPPPCNRPGHRHRSIGNLHAFLHSHRQTSRCGHRQTLIIGTNMSPPLDLATFNCLFIGNHLHRQLLCRLVIIASFADLCFTNPQVRVKRYVSKNGVNNYMSRIVGLILLNSCNCSYSVYLIDRWVDDSQYIDVVSRYLVCL